MAKRQHKPRGPGRHAKALPWRRILVPIDFSHTSVRALRVAVPLARDHRARLFLLSVVEPAVFTAGMESVAMAVPDSAIAKEARDNLLRIAKRLIPAENSTRDLPPEFAKPGDNIIKSTKNQHGRHIVSSIGIE